jgi:hypothetical protein
MAAAASSPARRELDRRHLERQQVVQGGLDAALGRVLAVLPLGEEAPDPVSYYGAQALPLVQASQRQALTLAAGYAASAARLVRIERGQAAAAIVGPLDLGAALVPVLATPASATVRSPALRLLARIGEGVAEAEARSTAAGYASQLAGGDLQVAQRAGLSAGADASGARIVGWRKQPSGGACAWCQTVASSQYHDAEAVPFHAGDRCTVAPVYADEGG